MPSYNGLLQKASFLLNQKLAFCNFVLRNNISNCAVFSLSDQGCYIINSFGLDAKTILLSPSTLSFWKGTIEQENKIYNYSQEDNNLTQFLQFFSGDLKDKITSLSICKSSEQNILMLINSEINYSILQDYSSLDLSYFPQNQYLLKKAGKLNMYFEKIEINYSQIIQNLEDQASYNKIFDKTIQNEIKNRLNSFFGDYSLIEIHSKSIIKILFIKTLNFPFNLLQEYLENVFKDFFKDFYSDIKISIEEIDSEDLNNL